MKNVSSRLIATVSFALCVVMLGTVPLQAALTYSISLVGPNTVNINSPFTLDVVLTETATAGEATVLGNPAFGIFQGNFRVNRTGAGNIAVTGVNGSASFDSPISNSFSVNSAELAQLDLNPTPTPTGTLVSPGTYRFVLGTINLLAGSAGENTFTLIDFDPTTDVDDLVLGDLTKLDSIVTYGSLSITAVPEPSSMALLAIAGVGSLSYQLRRRLRSSAVK